MADAPTEGLLVPTMVRLRELLRGAQRVLLLLRVRVVQVSLMRDLEIGRGCRRFEPLDGKGQLPCLVTAEIFVD